MFEDVTIEALAFLRSMGGAGSIAFIALHMLLASLGLPCSPLTVVAGVLWGPFLGFFYSLLALIMSCALTFVISRQFGSRALKLLPGRLEKKVANYLSGDFFHDWRSVVLFSANPVIPAASAGYLFGLTTVGFYRYIILTAVSVIPLQFIYVFIGDGLLSSLEQRAFVKISLGIIMLVILSILYRVGDRKPKASI